MNSDTHAAKPLRTLFCVVAVLLHSSIAAALDLSDRISLNGFYSLDLSYSDSDGALIPTSNAPILLDEGDSTSDASLIGAQIDFTLTDELSFTLQAVATGQSEEDYEPSVEWAYLSYDLGRNLHLRAGRFIVPFLQGTELRYVGYSRIWASPLVPNSGAGGFEDYDGLELVKSLAAGDYNLTIQAAAGRADHHKDFVDNNHILLVSGKLEKGGSWVNLTVLQADYDIDTITGIDIRDGAKALMASIEAELLFGNTIFNAGYSTSDVESGPDEEMVYLSIGYRLRDSTPYLLFLQRDMAFDAAEQIPDNAPLLSPSSPPPATLLDGNQQTQVTALGMRYDLGDSWALKLQWEYWELDDTSQGSGAIDIDGNLFTVAIEGVF